MVLGRKKCPVRGVQTPLWGGAGNCSCVSPNTRLPVGDHPSCHRAALVTRHLGALCFGNRHPDGHPVEIVPSAGPKSRVEVPWVGTESVRSNIRGRHSFRSLDALFRHGPFFFALMFRFFCFHPTLEDTPHMGFFMFLLLYLYRHGFLRLLHD